MNITQLMARSGLTLALVSSAAFASPIDPDCTPEKVVKGAAAKSTVGVGGRCSAGEAAKDSGKKAVGIEDKGPIEKKKDKNDTPAEKAKDVVKR
jgi:hypothetical protein